MFSKTKVEFKEISDLVSSPCVWFIIKLDCASDGFCCGNQVNMLMVNSTGQQCVPWEWKRQRCADSSVSEQQRGPTCKPLWTTCSGWSLATLFKTFGIPGLFWQQRQRHSLSSSLRVEFKARRTFLGWRRKWTKDLLDGHCVCVKTTWWKLTASLQRKGGDFLRNSVSSLAASPPLPSSRAGDPRKRVIIHDWAG